MPTVTKRFIWWQDRATKKVFEKRIAQSCLKWDVCAAIVAFDYFLKNLLFLKNDLEFYVRDMNGMSIRPESRARVKCAGTIRQKMCD